MKPLILPLLIVLLAGCASTDWQRAHALVTEADTIAGTWQHALGGDEADRIAEVRQRAAPVLAMIEARANDSGATDPTPTLRAVIAEATFFAQQWPDEDQRRVALATLSTLRLGLVLAGVRLDEGGEQ